MKRAKTNYLNNKDILKEIHKSKMSYCSVIDDRYTGYDTIVQDFDPDDAKTPYINGREFTGEIISAAKKSQAARIASLGYENGMAHWTDIGGKRADKPKQADYTVNPDSIPLEDIVVRVMTYDHVPEDLDRKKNPKTIADTHIKLNFPPFKHYANVDGEWKEVARSQWIGGFDNGYFSLDHGRTTNKLGHMMIKLCDKYALKPNWRNYTYVDEMKNAALLQLSHVCLKFNEAKGDNPFAYYTTTITNSFTRVLLLEKRNQGIRDDMLQQAGYMPSFNRQMEDELNQQKLRKETEMHETAVEEMKKAGYHVE